jgi:hypothetical protein
MWGKLMIALGALTTIGGLLGWGMEPLEEAHEDHDQPAVAH